MIPPNRNKTKEIQLKTRKRFLKARNGVQEFLSSGQADEIPSDPGVPGQSGSANKNAGHPIKFECQKNNA